MLENRWHDRAVDTGLYVQLQDLAAILSKINLQLDFTYGSYIDMNSQRLTVSSLWEITDEKRQIAGYYSDIYLRALGTIHYTNLQSFERIRETDEFKHFPSFLQQLITLFEDIRLEEIIKSIRPGTVDHFIIRTNYLKHHFSQRLTIQRGEDKSLDQLFCLIYLTLQARGPEQDFSQVNPKQLEFLEQIKSYIYDVFSVTSTKDVVHLALKIVQRILNVFTEDMNETYFSWPIFAWEEKLFRKLTLFDELTRTDEVMSSKDESLVKDDQEYIDETFSTWHSETDHQKGEQTFLHMDLDTGIKTDIKGGSARETERGDQAFAAVQGTSQKSKQDHYKKLKTLEQREESAAHKGDETRYGIDNVHAKSLWKYANQPTASERQLYKSYVADIEGHKRKLARTIEKVIDHKQSFIREHLHFGRLSKNLLPIVTEDFPRLFYKKDAESEEFDAVFTLMVDCSASMYDKMTETKRGIVLFHEVLKSLKIPHKIVGFWEAATVGKKEEWPNYFQVIHSFTDSLYESQGAKIMQLAPEEDNRDGYSIRVITERILERRENYKVLLVFSDGEPSAEGYDQNGIIDTQQAVSEAKKQGIDVIGMFLANNKINEQTNEMMKHIYGSERVMISDVAYLPEYFLPVLRRLILRMI